MAYKHPSFLIVACLFNERIGDSRFSVYQVVIDEWATLTNGRLHNRNQRKATMGDRILHELRLALRLMRSDSEILDMVSSVRRFHYGDSPTRCIGHRNG